MYLSVSFENPPKIGESVLPGRRNRRRVVSDIETYTFRFPYVNVCCLLNVRSSISDESPRSIATLATLCCRYNDEDDCWRWFELG